MDQTNENQRQLKVNITYPNNPEYEYKSMIVDFAGYIKIYDLFAGIFQTDEEGENE